MSAYHDFVESEEYKNWTIPKKEVFQRHAREIAVAKSPRVIDLSTLDLSDIQKLKKKVEDIK